jgi:hypothetical protein
MMWMCQAMFFGSVGSALGSQNIVTKKVNMRTSTNSGNDKYGAKQNMTKKWRQTEHDKRRNGDEQH